MLSISDIPERKRAKAERWIKIISEQSKSGLSVKQYCQTQQVNSSTFYYWFNYLNGKTVAPNSTIHKQKRKEIRESNTKKLIALKVVPSPETINSSYAPCVLHFPNGLFLKIYDANILPILLKGFI